MSIIGKGASSLKKKDVMEQKSIALGFKKVRFAHKATIGDTGIDVTSLVQPTEMATYGFVNPNASELARAQINLFRNNLKLVSSTKGLLVDQLSYTVASSTRINFIDFTADDGEIFVGWLDEAPTTSLSVVDGQNVIASGVLTAGSTDFNVGTPIPINQNAGKDIGAVMVFADRGLQLRRAGNAAAGSGDYYEVPVAGGLGSIIRFATSAVDRYIVVVSNGVVAERPDGSMTAMIERAQGQIDAMVPTLAALAGVPTTNFQTGPNSVDLKQFGDLVTSLNTSVTALQTALAAKYDTAKGTGKKIGFDHTAGSATGLGVNDLHFVRFIAANDGILTRTSAFKSAQAAGIKSNMAIYSSVGGLPSIKLGQTNEHTTAVGSIGSADGGLVFYDLQTPVTIVKGQSYWISYWTDTTANMEHAFNSPTTGLFIFKTITYSTSQPASVSAPFTLAGATPSLAGY